MQFESRNKTTHTTNAIESRIRTAHNTHASEEQAALTDAQPRARAASPPLCTCTIYIIQLVPQTRAVIRAAVHTREELAEYRLLPAATPPCCKRHK
jgi:hypothetical protein